MASSNRFSMLDIASDSEEEAPKVEAPVVSKTAAQQPKASNNTKKAPVKAAPAAASTDPDAEAKQDAKRDSQHHNRNLGTRKREFDRKSGTGRDKTVQKGGAGKGNWGKEGEEVAPEVAPEEVKEAEPEAPAEPEAAEPVVEEEPDNTITLEEFQRQQREKKASASSEVFRTLEVRKVESSFAGARKVVKKDVAPAVEDAAETRQRDRNTKEKRAPEVGFTSSRNTGSSPRDRAPRGDREDRVDRPPRGDRPPREDREDRPPRVDRPPREDREDRPPRGDRPPREDRPPRGEGFRGGGRGGRGGFRGGRGGFAGPRGGASGLNIQDQAAFPSLG